jgi:hypothetical protein
MTGAENRPRSRTFDWTDAALIAVLVAVILTYFRSILWTDMYIYGELDIRRHFYLFRKVSYELMRGNELPLWIPYIYCGMPLLAASQVTPYYPPDLLFMAARIPLNMTFNWDLLLHLAAAQVFSYLFFRRLFRRRAVAVFCSMWFWNVFFLNSISSGDALNIRAMLLVPVVFYFVAAALGEDGRPWHFLLGAAALSMQLLCGGLQFTFYTLVAAGLYAGFLLVDRARKGEAFVRPAIGFGAIVIVALAISAVQLMPAWEYGRLSVRASGVAWFKIWAIEPRQLVEYVFPAFEGEGRGHGYFGIAPLVLAAFAVPVWQSPRKYFFLGLAAISIIYSMGGNTALSSLLAGLPVVRGFRGAFRGAIFFDLSVFALAGGALASLVRATDGGCRRRRFLAPAVVSVVLVAGFLAAVAHARGYAGWSVARGAASAAFLVLSLALVWALLLHARRPGLFALAFVALLACDLALTYGDFYAPSSVADMFSKDVAVRHLESEHRAPDSRIAVYNTAHLNYLGLFGFESANGHHPFPPIRYAMFLPLLKEPKTASLAGVDRTLIYGAGEDGRPHDPPVESLDDVFIAPAVSAPLPRTFLVQRYRVLSLEESLAAMQGRTFDPSSEVLLEEAPAGIAPPAGLPVQGSATVVTRTANGVAVETESEHDALLVLTESYYPGWTARVDGAPKKVLAADAVFRAVPVSAGRHKIVFTFDPAMFRVGVAVSWAGMAAWTAWALLLLVRRRCGALLEKRAELRDE